MRPVLENETVQVARSAVLTVLLILGCAALVNAFLGMILSISGFPVKASAVSIMDGLKRMGYYIGHLKYSSSCRLLPGFALVAQFSRESKESHRICDQGLCIGRTR